MIPIKEVVNNTEWQILRKSFIGTWMENKEENVHKLIIYLGDFSDPIKNRRVLNYLTGSAFRIGIIKSELITQLVKDIKKHKRS